MEGRLWREGWCWTCPAAGGTLQKRAAGRNTRAGINLITVGVSLQSGHTPYQQRALWCRFLCGSWDDPLSQRFSSLNVAMATWNRAPLSYKHARFLVALRFVGLNQWLKTSWIRHLRTSPRLGVIFDTISIKARSERWCRWNCDLRVINARKKCIFCRTESVAMTPKTRDHMPTTSLWGVAAQWPARAPKTKLILCPRDPQGYSRISLSLSGRILKEYRNIVSASTCGIPWGLRNRTRWSARYTNGRDAVQQESQLVWIV